jgi:hypothetical protein
LILWSDDEYVDLYHIIKTNETPIHPTKERRWKYACIFETRKKAGILIGSTRERERGRERGCAYLLRKSDSETVFRLHTVRPSGYVDEAKKEE